VTSTPSDDHRMPRLELKIYHEGLVEMHTCEVCGGTPEQVIAMLENVIEHVRNDPQ
jgi:hypothetical protein